jgi:dienelactone hydrolase
MRWEGEEHTVRVAAGPVCLDGNLSLPEGARGIVLFAHGSGSSRLSPRNRQVAQLLNHAKLATLLVDLLTPEEEVVDLQTAQLRFDIELLAKRLVGVTDWLTQTPETRQLRIGYFGASTGAGAALVAAAERPELVGAVVSRGGRPDLAGSALTRVRAPTLLIVGGNDVQVIALNRRALAQLHCEKQLVIVPGATHLFEEPGALDQVALLARDWFERHLAQEEVPTREEEKSMAVKLNRRAYEYAKRLISEGKFVFDERDAWSEHRPSAQQENEFIRQNGFAEYGKWYLGINDEKGEQTKGHYEFPFGDFQNVHRCGVLSAESRAGQYKHYDIENAAAHLHGMIRRQAIRYGGREVTPAVPSSVTPAESEKCQTFGHSGPRAQPASPEPMHTGL